MDFVVRQHLFNLVGSLFQDRCNVSSNVDVAFPTSQMIKLNLLLKEMDVFPFLQEFSAEAVVDSNTM